MKKNIALALVALLLSVSSCDKDFEEINTNPNLATDLDPVYLLNNAQFSSANFATHHYEGQIVQQLNTPYTGTLEAGNHNVLNDANTRTLWNGLYEGPIRNTVAIIEKTKDHPAMSNLYNMARIVKAYNFLVLVDTYGDIPYFEAGKGFISSTYLPKYDDQKLIYDDLLKELDEAAVALDAAKPSVTGGDIFYNGNIGRWKKLANSLLLRVAMRYTESELSKADQWVDKAFARELMTSNDDNAVVRFNAPAYVHPTPAQLTSTEKSNYFAGEPFVNFMKTNNDPRAPYLFVRYSAPGTDNGGIMNTNLADQFGLPFGYSDVTIKNAPGWRGAFTEYSQFRRNTVLNQSSPEFLVTHAQTQLLLAEAAHRGFISGDAKTYYETGVKAHMDQIKGYDANINISDAEKNAYLQQPGILFNPANALEQINTQYWVASFRSWSEAWANFRRTELPRLQPINYPGEDPSVKGNFIRRLVYPNREVSVNQANVNEAISRMGPNALGTRLFWDE
ncbi:SusD/RagB family nutrient-binding outer membrane lipoprotein [Adhaeribacter rhizoryzae]|uniref:SusD/RagB family nutrient-binding outer membrane lipoprotein n=1 Tax=Adhaeribacter rhizoryzae TaxID=2607907 RepID=A0A5M6DCL1_9BACT|nr:SusD/RagB family nutrient-binding outer membrane lipoprotein [Adhaeribacter rhizoryzae]KAA5542895.1 SusD/RagB family nutrient-binding outer membrane lipoprotein [Adhaeribacter rhizoryzae]